MNQDDRNTVRRHVMSLLKFGGDPTGMARAVVVGEDNAWYSGADINGPIRLSILCNRRFGDTNPGERIVMPDLEMLVMAALDSADRPRAVAAN